MNIPLIDIKRRYAAIAPEASRTVLQVLESGRYISGEHCRAFEQEFASFVGTSCAVAVGNGTDALEIAMRALGIGSGDEVITAAFSFFATAEAIAAVGALPVFADINPHTFNIDENSVEEKITQRTRAILPVHLFGQPAEMDILHRIAKRHGIYIIEDACQAVGAEYYDKKAGALGDIACFSFFPTKNLSCAGDGGMITTNSPKLMARCRALANHGGGENGRSAAGLTALEGNAEGKYYNYIIGGNSRLDEIQAALLRLNLARLPQATARRRTIAEFYINELSETSLVLPSPAAYLKHAYHLFVVQTKHREAVAERLAAHGIATGCYYPVPLHLQYAFKELGYKAGSLPVSERLAQESIAIPLYPELTDAETQYIVKCTKEVAN